MRVVVELVEGTSRDRAEFLARSWSASFPADVGRVSVEDDVVRDPVLATIRAMALPPEERTGVILDALLGEVGFLGLANRLRERALVEPSLSVGDVVDAVAGWGITSNRQDSIVGWIARRPLDAVSAMIDEHGAAQVRAMLDLSAPDAPVETTLREDGPDLAPAEAEVAVDVRIVVARTDGFLADEEAWQQAVAEGLQGWVGQILRPSAPPGSVEQHEGGWFTVHAGPPQRPLGIIVGADVWRSVEGERA